MTKIFISYRRDDSIGHAGRLYDRLVDHLSENEVFMDVSSIPASEEFQSYIEQVLAECSVCIVVIGRNWSLERLHEKNDFVRREIHAALSSGIRVVPALFDDAIMPDASNLPAELKGLTECQSYNFVSGRDFRQQVGQLLSEVDKAIAEAKQRKIQREREALRSIAYRPYQYPIWVLFICGLIFLSAAASVVWVPKQIRALGSLWKAKEAYASGDHSNAIRLYRETLYEVPTSRKAKIGLVIALFASKSESATSEALDILTGGLEIYTHELGQIINVMPEHNQKLMELVEQMIEQTDQQTTEQLNKQLKEP